MIRSDTTPERLSGDRAVTHTATGGPDGTAPSAVTTRAAILAAAERLYAERGIFGVTHRQVGIAARVGDMSAVTYHFGGKSGLVRAVVRPHLERIDLRCRPLVDRAVESGDVGQWVTCLVRPISEHLAESGGPTWFARFIAQLAVTPGFRDVLNEERLASSVAVAKGLRGCLPELAPDLRDRRNAMARQLIVGNCAEHERRIAADPDHAASWHTNAEELVDAVTAIYLAPVGARSGPDADTAGANREVAP
ncbi:TetR/AcrR family transcriptional regulator [Nocardia aurea]|uniref:TetR/AcrR family transcriptional regulator n=1 Tax=Nocardia aurea TaxID=2144174 RepID=UPI0033B65AB0